MKTFLKIYLKNFFTDLLKILVVVVCLSTVTTFIIWVFSSYNPKEIFHYSAGVFMTLFFILDYLLIPVKKHGLDFIAKKQGMKPEIVYEMVYIYKIKADTILKDKKKAELELITKKALKRFQK